MLVNEIQRTPERAVNNTQAKRRHAEVMKAITPILDKDQLNFVTFYLLARGPKKLKSTLLDLASNFVLPEDKRDVAPLAGRASGHGFTWKRGKGKSAEVLLRVPKRDAAPWLRSLVSMENVPSNSRLKILRVNGTAQFISDEEEVILKSERNEIQLGDIEKFSREAKRFIIIPSSEQDHSDGSSGEDIVITIASDSDMDSDSKAARDAVTNATLNTKNRVYNVFRRSRQKKDEELSKLKAKFESQQATIESQQAEIDFLKQQFERANLVPMRNDDNVK